jgi:hypothetical protein
MILRTARYRGGHRALPAVTLSLVIAATTFSTPSRAGDKEACAGAAEQAQKFRSDKKLLSARERLIACSRDVCPAVIRKDCVKWLPDVEAALPTIIVRVRDAQNKDVINVKVSVDGEPFAAVLDGTAHPVDPGPHTFRYEAPGTDAIEEQVLVSQGEKDRVLKVLLAPAGSKPPEPTHKPTVPDESAPPPATEGSKPSALPWVIGAIGVAGLVTFGIFETVGQLGYADLKNGCGSTPQKCAPSAVDPLRIELGVAFVGLIVGVVGVGTAAGILLFRSSPAKAAAKHFDLVPLAGGAYGGFKTTF